MTVGTAVTHLYNRALCGEIIAVRPNKVQVAWTFHKIAPRLVEDAENPRTILAEVPVVVSFWQSERFICAGGAA